MNEYRARGVIASNPLIQVPAVAESPWGLRGGQDGFAKDRFNLARAVAVLASPQRTLQNKLTQSSLKFHSHHLLVGASAALCCTLASEVQENWTVTAIALARMRECRLRDQA